MAQGLLDYLYEAAQKGASLLAPNSEDVKFRQQMPGLLADFTPVLGDAKSVYDGVQSAREGDWLGAGMGALGALPFVPNMAGMFVGKGSKVWDALAAQQAKEMLEKGASKEEIWKATGTGWEPSGKAIQEVSDHGAEFLPVPSFFTQNTGTRQANVMKHPDLYSSGYGLENVIVNRNSTPESYWLRNSGDEVIPAFSSIGIGSKAFKTTDSGKVYGAKPDMAISHLLHENQHAIQDMEGFAPGANDAKLQRMIDGAKSRMLEAKKQGKYPSVQDSKIISKYGADVFDAYQRTAGEAMSRLTQSRQALTPYQRLQNYPFDARTFKESTGVDLEKLILD